MHKLARVAVAGAVAASLLPAVAVADDTLPYGARVVLSPGASFRIPANRTALVTGRLNPCYLHVTGGAGHADMVLERNDDVRGVALLAGETVTNLGGSAVNGGHFPRVTCLVSLLMYAGGPNPAAIAPPPK